MRCVCAVLVLLVACSDSVSAVSDAASAGPDVSARVDASTTDAAVSAGEDAAAADGGELLGVDAAISAPDGGAPPADAGAPPAPWSPCPRLPGGPRQETAVVARDGELYVLGGFDGASRVVSSVEIYDPVSGAWRAGPALPVTMHHAHAAVVGSRLFVLGFLRGLDFRADGRGYVLEPGATAWAPVAALPAGTERGGGATAVVGTRIYVIGGLRGGAVAEVSIYDTTTDTFTAGPALPEPRDHLGAAGVGDQVVVIGGRTGRIESHQSDTWILDQGASSWRSARPMPTSRGGFALAGLGSRLYVFGGEGNGREASGVFADVEVYDVAADTWAAEAPMPEPRHGTGAAALGGTLYVPGGADRQAFAAVATCTARTP
jgi:N-acetylneuraminic acid mutarotase